MLQSLSVLPVLPFCKFVCTNSSNQISFVRLTLYHFLLLSPLIKIEKVDPVYSVTIWVLLPSDNTIRLPHDWENGALVYSPLRLYIPLRQSYLNQYRDLYPLLSGKTSSVLPALDFWLESCQRYGLPITLNNINRNS